MNDKIHIEFSISEQSAALLQTEAAALYDTLQHLQSVSSYLLDETNLQAHFRDEVEIRCSGMQDLLKSIASETEESGRDLYTVVQWFRDLEDKSVKDFSAYTSMQSPAPSIPVRPDILYGVNGQPFTGQPDVIFINGIQTDFSDFRGGLSAIRNSWQGKAVAGLYNPTDGKDILGGTQDVNEALNDQMQATYGYRFDEGNPSVEALMEHIRNHSGSLELVAHSQGAAIVAAALSELKREGVDLSNVTVTTFGGFGVDYPSGPEYHHYIHQLDPVPYTAYLTNFDARPDNLLQTVSNVTVMNSGENLLNSVNLIGDHDLSLYIENLEDFRTQEIQIQQGGILRQAGEILELSIGVSTINMLSRGALDELAFAGRVILPH